MVKAFQIASGPRVRFGRGEAARIGEEAKGLGMAKPMFVTDPGLTSSGALDSVLKGLEDASIDYQFYDQAEANPSDASILSARDFFSEHGCDGFIAAGGGSTMDTAKATLAIVANGWEWELAVFLMTIVLLLAAIHALLKDRLHDLH